MSDDSSELASRLSIAAVAIPALLYLIIWGPILGFVALVGSAGAVATWEYCSIAFGDEHRLGQTAAALSAVGLIVAFFAAPEFKFEAVLLGPVVLSGIFLFTFDDRSRVSHQIASSVLAFLLGGAFMGLLVLIRTQPHGSWWIILTLVTVWMSDTGAYFVGRAAGRHPLYESVSPNKSVEGSIGGFLGSLAGAFFCNWLFTKTADWSHLVVFEVLLFAVPANLLAQTGDLVESVVKRAHEVDDSGSLLGGHGGLLDRIDGLIYATPWFYICLVWILPTL